MLERHGAPVRCGIPAPHLIAVLQHEGFSLHVDREFGSCAVRCLARCKSLRAAHPSYHRIRR